jgi:hypothetical protein
MAAKGSSTTSNAWLGALVFALAGAGSLVGWRSCQQAPLADRERAGRALGEPMHVDGAEERRNATTPSRAAGPSQEAAASGATAPHGIVQTSEGLPIGGASVCVRPETAACCAAAACTQSDRSGRFTLDTAPGGSFLVTASAPSFLSAEERVASATGMPLTLVLHAGGARVTGSVVDASGGPVGNALLTATHAAHSSPALAFSDAAGRFTLTVPPGDVQVTAQADGYSLGEGVASAPQQGLTLTVTGASSLVGRVLFDTDLAPASDAEVVLHNQNGLRMAPRATRTDAQGAFDFQGLAAGNYLVSALSTAGRADERWIALEIGEKESLEITLAPATVLRGRVSVGNDVCAAGRVELDGPVTDLRPLNARGQVEFLGVLPGLYQLRIYCEQAVTLSEELHVDRAPLERAWTLMPGLLLKGVASTSSGTPLAGARVDVNPHGPPLERDTTSCVTDEAGRFECSGLLPGQYDCQLYGNAGALSDPVRVRLGADDPGEVALRAQASASLRARVEGGEALDLTLLSVLAWRGDEPPVMAERAAGEFVFEALPLGEYQVALDPSVPGRPQRAALTHDGQVVSLTFSGVQTGTLSGRVVDERGEGIPDAWVRASGTSEQALFRTSPAVLSDGAGLFTIAGLPRGDYRLLASSSAGEGRVERVLSPANDVSVTLHRHGSLSGRVTDAANLSVSDFVVEYSRAQTDAVDRVPGRAGAWSLPWLEPGSYVVAVTARAGSARATVDVAPGSEATLVMTLNASGRDSAVALPPD